MIEVKMTNAEGIILLTQGKRLDENVKVVLDESLIWDGSCETLDPIDPEGFVSGVWVFNEDIPTSHEHFMGVEFTCGWDEFNEIRLDSKPWRMEFDYNGNGGTTVWYTGTWIEEKYRTIDFGVEPQEVSPEFYAWLTANAVKQ